MTGRFRDLVERRVPQYLGIYVGVSWGIVQVISFFERYDLNPVWTDITLVVLALLIPSVLLITHSHGRPGRDEWTRAAKIGVPLNLIAVAGVLFLAFGGRDLGALTRKVSVTDESGKSVERTVAKSEHRKRLAMFNFDADVNDTTVAWLREGAAMALAVDLSQDIFLDVRPAAQFREQVRAAGFPDGNGIPLSLKQKLAADAHLPYFVTGSVSKGLEGYTVRVAVYETETLKKLGERVSTSHDVLNTIDDLSSQVRTDLGLPDKAPEGVKDLPVAELLSDKPEAVRALVEADRAGFRDDWKTAESQLVRATSIDPAFALAHYSLYLARVYTGNVQGGLPSLELAMRHDYKLPERTKFGVKIEHYFMRQEMDKASAVIEMMISLYPDDIQAHAARAQLQEMRADNSGAVASLRKIIDLDPNQSQILLKIGELQLQAGDAAAAEKTYQEYVSHFPNEVKGYLPLSGVQVQLGRHADARATADRALLLDPTHVEAKVARATVDLNTGDFDSSWKTLQDALSAARTAEDQSRVWEGIAAFHTARGQYKLAIAATGRLNEALTGYLPPVIALSRQMSALGLYARAGRVADAERVIDRVRTTLTSPMDKFWRMGQLELASVTRDTVQLHPAMAGVDSVMRAFGFTTLQPRIHRGDAVLHEARGDWAGALQRYQKQLETDPSEIAVQRDIARMHRMLNRLDEARTAIDQHLRVSPASAESNLEAARIALARGDAAGAAAHIDRVRRALTPADPGSAILKDLAALEASTPLPGRAAK